MRQIQDVIELLGEVESNPLITTKAMSLPDFILSAMEDTFSDMGQAIATLSALNARSYSGAPMISDLIARGKESKAWDDVQHYCLIRAGDEEALASVQWNDLPLSSDLWQRDFPLEVPNLTGLSREGRMRAVLSCFAESVLADLAPRRSMAMANALRNLTEGKIKPSQQAHYSHLFFKLGMELASSSKNESLGITESMFRGSEFLTMERTEEFLNLCEEYSFEWALASFDWAAAPEDYRGPAVMERLREILGESPW